MYYLHQVRRAFAVRAAKAEIRRCKGVLRSSVPDFVKARAQVSLVNAQQRLVVLRGIREGRHC